MKNATKYQLSDSTWETLTNLSNSFYKNKTPAKHLARHVMTLSKNYQKNFNSHEDIWKDDQLTRAYLNYNLPLNTIRAMAAIKLSGLSNYCSSQTHVYDFGSGPGTTHLALNESDIKMASLTNIEVAKKPIEVHKKLIELRGQNKPPNASWANSMPEEIKPNSLAIFNYSYNELETWPKSIFDFETILIIEPSTQEVSRRLQSQRELFSKNGFSSHAPCVHDKPCPLLSHSKTDWCHTRIFFETHTQISNIENHMPIKNTSLTFSYLLLSKKPRLNSRVNVLRVIGDTKVEKGKTRQAICRGENREFLTWLKRDHKKPSRLERGSLYELPEEHEVKGNEIRVKKKED